MRKNSPPRHDLPVKASRLGLGVWLLLCVVVSGCSPISYVDPSTHWRQAEAGETDGSISRLEALKTALERYGQAFPLDGEPGFWVMSPDYTLRARLVANNDIDLSVYWKPGRDCDLDLLQVIADIRSRMAGNMAGGYSLQKQQ